MRFSEEFRDPGLVQEIVCRIRQLKPEPATIMEVCGTHTMAVARFGLKALLPPQVKLLSGPGCPVCVTANEDLDTFLALGKRPRTILASFGDMLRVPGSETSLERERARGAEVRLVYAPLDAVTLAKENPQKQVIFGAVGFETTILATALALKAAAAESLDNFSVFCLHKTMPPALRALLTAGEVKVSGLLLPGHVTTIIGAAAYHFIPEEFRVPCAVAGFEPVDILLGIEAILRQLQEGVAQVDNAYPRAVSFPPNLRAQELLREVFTPSAVTWRGLGEIPASGVKIRGKYSFFDAWARFPEVLAQLPPRRSSPCQCGEILRGTLTPQECRQFARTCTPAHPLGPCMVSHEGTCAAVYRYERVG